MSGAPGDPLAPGVWPVTAHRGPAGALVIGGVDVRDLVAEHPTPVFVCDEVDVRERAAAYRAAYAPGAPALGAPAPGTPAPVTPAPGAEGAHPPGEVYYAAKAFLAGTLIGWLAEAGLGIDVCTGGELACVLRSGLPASRVILHGNNKSVGELTAALDAGIGLIVVDSFDEIARLGFLAEGREPIRVLLRVTPGVAAHTHEFIATAHEDQKFGFSLAGGQAAEAVARIIALPQLHLAGLHCHIGSQIFDAAGFAEAADRVVAFAARVHAAHGLAMEVLNLGGGMGIAYLADDDPLDVAAMAERLRGIVRSACTAHGLPLPRLAVEPGRAIIGPSMVTLYTVGTIKPVTLDAGEVRTYVSVDGGMSDNPRTSLYGAQYTVVLASRVSEAPLMACRVVGKHCETGDVVVRDAWLPADLVPGDLLAVPASGAYHRSMASQYNLVPRPGVIAVRQGRTATVLRAETLDDLFAADPLLTAVPESVRESAHGR
ncbi:MAG: diaminopimelate decarboxylase [Actinomycetales bacterium]|nr:diaminopimelate decarboxylase [Actinomycetales bacterium]